MATGKNKEAARQKAITAARLALGNAVMETRKKIYSNKVLDDWLPYPLYRVDADNRKVILANAIEISITRSGKIHRKALRPDVNRALLDAPMDQMPRLWAAKLNDNYRKQRNAAIDLCQPCPKGWGEVRRAAKRLVKLDATAQWNCICWLDLRYPFSSAWLAGIRKIDAIGRLFKADVGRLIESLPGPAMIKNSFYWLRPVKTLDPVLWNRLVSLLPLYAHLKRENKRLATPYMFDNCWNWLTNVSWIKRPEVATVEPQKAISTWRASLLNEGLTPGGWRWMTRLPPPQLMALLKAHRDKIQLINLIVRRQLPAHVRVNFWINDWNRISADPESAPAVVALFEAVIHHRYDHRKSFGTGKNRKVKEQECWEQIRDVLDYLQYDQRNTAHLPDPEILTQLGLDWPNPGYATEGATLQVPKGVSFDWFVRRSKEWHTKMAHVWEARNDIWIAVRAFEDRNQVEAARLRKQAMERKEWDSLVGETTINGYDIIPLRTGLSLVEEGAAMRHCVAGYVDLCVHDGSRIFSMMRDGKRLATLEIGPQGRSYGVLQVRGKCNASVSNEIRATATEVANLYSDLVRQSEKKAA